MLAALALAAQLAAIPMPAEEVVVSSKEMVQPPPTGRTARLLIQSGAGLALGITLGLVAMETDVASVIPCPEGELPSCPNPRAESLRFGFGVGAGLGVLGAGELLDGHGSYLGMGLGMGLGLTTALLISTFSPELGTLASVTLPLAGALTGYELGSADSNRFSVRPRFSVGSGRVTIGLTGDF